MTANNLRSWLPASVREDLLEPMPAVLFGTGIKRLGLYKKVPIARSWNPWAPQVSFQIGALAPRFGRYSFVAFATGVGDWRGWTARSVHVGVS